MARPSHRAKIVEGALETFHAHGFNGSSVQDVTERAGVPKGSFFNHFKSKELLALEVLDLYNSRSKLGLLSDTTLPPLDRLRAHFEFLAQRYDTWNYTRGCLVGNFGTELSDSHPQIREALEEALEVWSAAVAAILREAQTAGDLDESIDADRLGAFLVNSWEGAVLRLKVVKHRGPLDQFFAICFPLLLQNDRATKPIRKRTLKSTNGSIRRSR